MTDFKALAKLVYDYAINHYGDKDARYDVIVECYGKSEIACALIEESVTDEAGAKRWADRFARGQHEVELNQAWDGPESCIGSSLYDPDFDPRCL